MRPIIALVLGWVAFTGLAASIHPSVAGAKDKVATPVLSQRSQVQPKTDAIAVQVGELKKSNQRWIQVILSRQRLIAWQGKTPIYAVIVSTGKAGMETPVGVFAIQSKLKSARMRGVGYDVADVPYTMYYDGNYAIHGTYWHHKFGTPVSHGCVNVAVDRAQWLFDWAKIGTPVVVQEK